MPHVIYGAIFGGIPRELAPYPIGIKSGM